MNLTCVLCLSAFESHAPTGGYGEHIREVTDRPLAASVIYRGMSLCMGHFNTERGHAVDFVRYPQEPADAHR